MLAECDTLLMVGSGFPYTEFLPKEGQARGVQIDIDGGMLSVRYPMEVNLIGDSARTLRALRPLLQAKTDQTWRQQIAAKIAAWWQEAEERAMHEASPLNPQRVFWELSERLPENCILTADSGSATVWYARDLRLRRGMLASVSGTLATMGSALPYATAAKFVHPDRPVLAAVGDGAMQMSGFSALLDIARHWRRWSDPRLVVLVLNNRDLSYVTWEQRAMEGEPKFEASQAVPDFPYASFAELVGLRGLRVDRPDAVAEACQAAFAADRPVVLETVTDPNVPTLPPQLKPEQQKKLAQALDSGDPDADAVRRLLAVEGYELGGA